MACVCEARCAHHLTPRRSRQDACTKHIAADCEWSALIWKDIQQVIRNGLCNSSCTDILMVEAHSPDEIAWQTCAQKPGGWAWAAYD